MEVAGLAGASSLYLEVWLSSDAILGKRLVTQQYPWRKSGSHVHLQLSLVMPMGSITIVRGLFERPLTNETHLVIILLVLGIKRINDEIGMIPQAIICKKTIVDGQTAIPLIIMHELKNDWPYEYVANSSYAVE